MALTHVETAPGALRGRARTMITSAVAMAFSKAFRLVTNRRAVLKLHELDDRMLDDIGISYSDLREASAAPGSTVLGLSSEARKARNSSPLNCARVT